VNYAIADFECLPTFQARRGGGNFVGSRRYGCEDVFAVLVSFCFENRGSVKFDGCASDPGPVTRGILNEYSSFDPGGDGAGLHAAREGRKQAECEYEVEKQEKDASSRGMSLFAFSSKPDALWRPKSLL
jgi:hypothetical protein